MHGLSGITSEVTALINDEEVMVGSGMGLVNSDVDGKRLVHLYIVQYRHAISVGHYNILCVYVCVIVFGCTFACNIGLCQGK